MADKKTDQADDTKVMKTTLINLVSASLIKEPPFESINDPTSSFGKMSKLVEKISNEDGEFVLKLALYVRQDLGLRGTSNLLATLAAYQKRCQPYVSCYLPKIVVLPSDWLQIATYARDLPLRTTTGLPTSLRKSLVSIFPRFNEHSLAKYNKEKAQQAKKKRAIARGDAEGDEAEGPYTLKAMIRMLHISQPAYKVMCLLGKRYPSDATEFEASGLAADGKSFDASQGGVRMRLPVPTTWETQLASQGNHAHVWDKLVADKQLPFMAMLRNLRNIILAGCSDATHDTITGRLTNEDQVAGSRQFPYRFFSAYDVLNDINPADPYQPNARATAGNRPAKPKKIPETAPSQEQIEALLARYHKALDTAVQLATKNNIRPIRGRVVVCVAVHDAMFGPLVAQGAKGIGSVRSMYEVALLLGVMFRFACESCDLVLFGTNTYRVIPYEHGKGILECMTKMKKVAEEIRDADASSEGDSEGDVYVDENRFPFPFFDKIIAEQQSIGALVVIDDGHKHYNDANPNPALGNLPHYLRKLRRHSNPDLLYVAVDVASKATGAGSSDDAEDDPNALNHPNDVMLSGFSDSILRFVAERGGGGPLRYVEHVHEVYGIDTSNVRLEAGAAPEYLFADNISDVADSEEDEEGSGMLPSRAFYDPESYTDASSPVPSNSRHLTTYRTCRFFVSSTFMDMQNERDALVLEVFPALRRLCERRGVKANVVEVDLRWGITAETAESNASLLDTCANEVARCSPFFLGMHGARRGYCPPLPAKITCDGDNDPADFKWLENAGQMQTDGTAPPPMSITEIETRQAWVSTARRGSEAPLLLMFRNQEETASTVPAAYKQLFTPENPAAASAGKKFKQFARTIETRLATYKAPFVELAKKDPLTTEAPQVKLDMSEFKRKALRLLWTAVTSVCPPDEELALEALSGGLEDEGSSTAAAAGTEIAPDSGLEGSAEHMNFLDKMVSTYVRQKEFFSKAVAFALGVLSSERCPELEEGVSRQVAVISSTEGCGKSAAMAAIASELIATQPGTCVIPHFFGVGGGDVASAVENVFKTLVHRLHLEDEFSWSSSLEDNLQVLPQLYAAAAKHARIAIVFDGLDSCSTPEQLTTALPQLVPNAPPANCYFFVSVRSTSTYLGAFRARKPSGFILPIPDLTKSERISFVRNHLRAFGKKLQESASKGNQLLPLIRKQDAGKPAYLLQALTHLRLFSTFATLDKDIRNMPPTIASLNKDVIKRFEDAFGHAVCSVVLPALVLSVPLGGIAETDLYRLCPDVSGTRRLLNLIESQVLYQSTGVILLIGEALASSIQRTYYPRTADIAGVHKRLADAFANQTVIRGPPKAGGSIFGGGGSSFGGGMLSAGFGSNAAAAGDAFDATKVAKLPARAQLSVLHHALYGGCFDYITSILNSFSCVESIVEAHLLPELLNVIAGISAKNRIVYKQIEPFATFLIAHRHILLRHPTLMTQCALNLEDTNTVYKTAVSGVANNGTSMNWLSWRNRDRHGERECTETTAVTSQPVLCVAFDAKADFMAVGGKDWTCRVIKVYDGTIPLKLKHPNSVTAVQFGISPARSLVTGCEDGVARIWSLHDGSILMKCQPHTRRINDIALHPQKPTLITASDDCTAKIWNLGGAQNQLRPVRTLRKHNGPVSCCAMHTSGKVFATGSWDGRVLLWEEERYTFFNPRRSCGIRSLAFIPSMVVTLAVATYDGKIDLYDHAAGHSSALFDQHQRHPITRVCFSADAKRMMTTDEAGGAKLWRASVTGEVLGTLCGHHVTATTAAFHPQSNAKLITASNDCRVRHWKTGDDEDRIGAMHGGAATAAVASHSGRFFVSAARDGKAHFIDLTDNQYVKFTIDHGAPITSIAVFEDDTHIVTGGGDGTVKVWKAEPGLNGRDGLKVAELARKHKLPVTGVSVRGNLVNSLDVGGTLRQFNYTKPEETITTKARDPVELDDDCPRDYTFLYGLKGRGVVVGSIAGVAYSAAATAFSKGGADDSTDYSDDSGTPYTTDSGTPYTSSDDDYSSFDDAQDECDGDYMSTTNPIDEDGCTPCSYTDLPWIISCTEGPKRRVAFGTATGTIAVHQGGVEIARRDIFDDMKRGGIKTAVNALAFLSEDELACACEDGTVRVYGISMGRENSLKLRNLYHATAPVRSLTCVVSPPSKIALGENQAPPGPLLACGDALGNIYCLESFSGTLITTAAGKLVRPADGVVTNVTDAALKEAAIADSGAIDALYSMGGRPSSSQLFGGDDDLFGDDDDTTTITGTAVTGAGGFEAEQEAARQRLEEQNARFRELMNMHQPPPEVRGLAKKDWHMRKQAMLKEAMKEMKHNPVARIAVRFQAERTMKSYSAYTKYLSTQ